MINAANTFKNYAVTTFVYLLWTYFCINAHFSYCAININILAKIAYICTAIPNMIICTVFWKAFHLEYIVHLKVKSPWNNIFSFYKCTVYLKTQVLHVLSIIACTPMYRVLLCCIRFKQIFFRLLINLHFFWNRFLN